MGNDVKKLKKSATNKTICGVCGGIGEYFNVDPTIIRIIWVILSFGSVGFGIILYFIVAVIIPNDTAAGISDKGTNEEV